MVLKVKDENNIEALCISSIYGEDNINYDTLLKNTYTNMYLSKSHKVLSVFLYYNKDCKIKKIDIRVLRDSDKEAKNEEILNMSQYLMRKRKTKIESKKIGRNELCPCR